MHEHSDGLPGQEDHHHGPDRPVATHVAVRDGLMLAVGDADCAAPWGEFDATTAIATRCSCRASSKATPT